MMDWKLLIEFMLPRIFLFLFLINFPDILSSLVHRSTEEEKKKSK